MDSTLRVCNVTPSMQHFYNRIKFSLQHSFFDFENFLGAYNEIDHN